MPAFDHLVIYSKDPKQHAEIFQSAHRLTAVSGGEHEHWGTFNFLAFMKNNSYIEWLGINHLELAEESDNPLIRHTVFADKQKFEGPIQFALRVSDLDDYIEHFEKNNIPFHGPFPGSQRRNDGSLLEWRMLFPEYTIGEAPFPFLIEWSGEGNLPERDDQLNQIPFTKVVVSVDDPALYKQQFNTIYRFTESDGDSFPLENGAIEVNQGNGLEVYFQSITFK